MSEPSPQPSARIEKLNFSFRRRLPVVLQNEVSECALACIAMISAFYGCHLSMTELRRRFLVSTCGSSITSLEKMARQAGLSPRSVRLELHELSQLRQPAILHWRLDHFVVLKKVQRKGIKIHDPALGRRLISWNDSSRYFTGIATELYPASDFETKPAAGNVRIWDLWDKARGLWVSLGYIFLLSTLLQLLALLSPLINQLVVDEAIARNDLHILTPILLGFALLILTQAAVETLRSISEMYFGQLLSFQLRSNLLWHLFRLPADFFEKRHIGDIVSRLDSLRPIQSLLSSSIIAVILDGILSIATFLVMLLYSPLLASAVVATAVLGFAARLCVFPYTRRLSEEQIQADAKRQSVLFESIRAIRAVKLFNRIAERHGVWQSAFVEATNIGIRLQKLGIAATAGSRTLSGALDITVFYFGAQAVVSGNMTLGMLFAFQAYRMQFSNRLSELVRQYFIFKAASIHLQRLADIVHTDPESPDPERSPVESAAQGKIEFRGVRFRYGDDQPWILDGVNCVIEPGERVALVGCSGGGKSTLLKLLLGLHDFQSGEILVNGTPLQTLGIRNARQQIGVVMQDDRLLSGTLADNISFFDQRFDQEQIVRAATLAEFHRDIARMPMGFDTLIGDMGSSLSGGQRQRILLARALYKRPRILLLDEGTANLDEVTEARVLQNLARLGLTQLVVAHRAAAIEACDRSISLRNGKLTQGPGPGRN